MPCSWRSATARLRQAQPGRPVRPNPHQSAAQLHLQAALSRQYPPWACTSVPQQHSTWRMRTATGQSRSWPWEHRQASSGRLCLATPSLRQKCCTVCRWVRWSQWVEGGTCPCAAWSVLPASLNACARKIVPDWYNAGTCLQHSTERVLHDCGGLCVAAHPPGFPGHSGM